MGQIPASTHLILLCRADFLELFDGYITPFHCIVIILGHNFLDEGADLALDIVKTVVELGPGHIVLKCTLRVGH